MREKVHCCYCYSPHGGSLSSGAGGRPYEAEHYQERCRECADCCREREGYGYDLKVSKITGIITIVGSIVLTILIYLFGRSLV